MKMYRAINRLDCGGRGKVERGSLTPLDWLDDEAKQKLMAVGAVTEVSPPPLGELPGWKLRAEKLKKVGITDALELLAMPDDELAKKARVKPKTVRNWKADVESWLVVAPEEDK